ncbi:hypothetical protein HZH66_005771 [Vespula vulgaris]|uniref:Uncharacterized protein n=1 Tax=Vespula vulgaris TaxID=7454 RepID=A0A834K728_VESVU|nr:hypothetical protein HZH66_005771 [Vespula vulgaris]
MEKEKGKETFAIGWSEKFLAIDVLTCYNPDGKYKNRKEEVRSSPRRGHSHPRRRRRIRTRERRTLTDEEYKFAVISKKKRSKERSRLEGLREIE